MNPHRYGPKSSLSPSLNDPCVFCGRPLVVGDYTTLVSRAANRRYADNAEVHWRCAVAGER